MLEAMLKSMFRKHYVQVQFEQIFKVKSALHDHVLASRMLNEKAFDSD